MTYPPTGPWQPQEPPPVGDPVYLEQPYPYAYPQLPYGGLPQNRPYPSQYAPQYPSQYGPQYPYPYGYAVPSPGPRRIASPAVGYGLLAAAVLLVAAAFMPWAQVFGISVNGTDGTGDGNVTLFLGTVVGAMGVVIACLQGRLWTSIVACIAATFAVITSFKDITDVNGFANDNGLDPSAVNVGVGLWLTLLAGLVALALSIVGIAKRAPRTG